MTINIKNPKNNDKNISYLYKYYAGFSAEFVYEILNTQKNDVTSILDPWNGSGTTSSVSFEYGVEEIYGFDINPVMPIIASGSLVEKKVELKLKQRKYLKNKDIKRDPLEQWFTKTSVKNIRNTELEIRSICLDSDIMYSDDYLMIDPKRYIELLGNSTLSYYYIVLFEAIKKLTGKFKTSNPTWMKTAKNSDEKLKISQKFFQSVFLDELKEKNSHETKNITGKSKLLKLQIADSRKLPILDKSIDLVVTSPPYCTRIDYAIATRLELATLGVTNEFELLRKMMIGTTKINNSEQLLNKITSDTAAAFLNAVYEHPSKSSKTYYYKQFSQYFYGIIDSIKELTRVVKINGRAVIVVQDSFYKNIHLDIATIFIEIFIDCGWKLVDKKDFEKKQSMVSMNKKTKMYRDISNPIETVIIFERMK